MSGFWRQVLARLQAHERVFMCLVAHNTRHSPGTRGARLGLVADGTTWGTMGGGVMEARTIAQGLQDLARHEAIAPYLRPLAHRKPEQVAAGEEPSGLICAGQQTNVHLVLEPAEHLPLVERLLACVEADLPATLMLSPEGLALDTEAPARLCPPAMRLHPTSAEGPWRVEEELLNTRRAAIIGGGHCALALSQTLAQLGYTVTVFETRPDVPTFTHNIFARHHEVLADFALAGPRIPYHELTHVIVMTADRHSDTRGLLGTILRPFPYIGVMGAPAKLAAIRRDLREAGIPPEAWERVHAPVGLPIPSHTPEEIAISIAAQILELRPKLFGDKE